MTVEKLIAMLQEVEDKKAQVKIAGRSKLTGAPLLKPILDIEDWSIEDSEIGVLIIPISN